jgi:hypothetical protein
VVTYDAYDCNVPMMHPTPEQLRDMIAASLAKLHSDRMVLRFAFLIDEHDRTHSMALGKR